jgi:hypothetical protein
MSGSCIFGRGRRVISHLAVPGRWQGSEDLFGIWVHGVSSAVCPHPLAPSPVEPAERGRYLGGSICNGAKIGLEPGLGAVFAAHVVAIKTCSTFRAMPCLFVAPPQRGQYFPKITYPSQVEPGEGELVRLISAHPKRLHLDTAIQHQAANP